MSVNKPAKKLVIGDLITNVSDHHPSFIGKVMSITNRQQLKEIHVELLKQPTRESQAGMPQRWAYPYEMAINLFRKLTEAEKLLYTLE